MGRLFCDKPVVEFPQYGGQSTFKAFGSSPKLTLIITMHGKGRIVPSNLNSISEVTMKR